MLVLKQIQKAMTTEQQGAIDAMDLESKDMMTAMQEAGLEPFEDDDSKTWMDVFAIGFGIGLQIGLGLIDFVEAMV